MSAAGQFPAVCKTCYSSPIPLEYVRSAYVFSGVMRQAIHQFKYRGVSSLAPVLASLLAEYVQAHPIPAGVIMPVPLHERRARERGYDQAGLLAVHLSRELGIPSEAGCLVRTRPTQPQVRTAGAAERRDNVRGAFRAAARLDPQIPVLLIDDVCTTGATLAACAGALRRAGVQSVYGLTLARDT